MWIHGHEENTSKLMTMKKIHGWIHEEFMAMKKIRLNLIN